MSFDDFPTYKFFLENPQNFKPLIGGKESFFEKKKCCVIVQQVETENEISYKQCSNEKIKNGLFCPYHNNKSNIELLQYRIIPDLVRDYDDALFSTQLNEINKNSFPSCEAVNKKL